MAVPKTLAEIKACTSYLPGWGSHNAGGVLFHRKGAPGDEGYRQIVANRSNKPIPDIGLVKNVFPNLGKPCRPIGGNGGPLEPIAAILDGYALLHSKSFFLDLTLAEVGEILEEMCQNGDWSDYNEVVQGALKVRLTPDRPVNEIIFEGKSCQNHFDAGECLAANFDFEAAQAGAVSPDWRKVKLVAKKCDLVQKAVCWEDPEDGDDQLLTDDDKKVLRGEHPLGWHDVTEESLKTKLKCGEHLVDQCTDLYWPFELVAKTEYFGTVCDAVRALVGNPDILKHPGELLTYIMGLSKHLPGYIESQSTVMQGGGRRHNTIPRGEGEGDIEFSLRTRQVKRGRQAIGEGFLVTEASDLTAHALTRQLEARGLDAGGGRNAKIARLDGALRGRGRFPDGTYYREPAAADDGEGAGGGAGAGAGAAHG